MNASVLILVVEDNELIQQVVNEALVDGGYAVHAVCTAEEAIAILDTAGFDLQALLTDIDLAPGKLTGWDVARHAREIIPALPVVYMSGASGNDWASKGVPKSVFIGKPFAPAQVLTAVSQLMNERSAGN